MRDDLVQAVVDTLDNSFLDPAHAGVPDVEPVSITSSIAPITATADLKALLAAFGGDLETAYFIAQGGIAAALADDWHHSIVSFKN